MLPFMQMRHDYILSDIQMVTCLVRPSQSVRGVPLILAKLKLIALSFELLWANDIKYILSLV